MDRTSLLYKVFSAKYFLSGSIFYAKVAKGSYAWQSILKARQVMEKGMIWRIGDGKKTRIFHDNWIPGVFPLKAAARSQEFLDDSMVSSLIDAETGEWNGQVIDQLISPFLVQRIKVIPLRKMSQEDCIAWPRSSDGNYTVKTGYQLLDEMENREVASSSDQFAQRSFWNGIWKLNISKKMQIFCWRACNEALLTVENLYKRKILDSPLCSSCGKANETVFQALWECEKIHTAWSPDFNSLRKLPYQPLTVMDLICRLGQEGRNVELFTDGLVHLV